MALKDLKSNLSEFRKPKSEPLSNKERPKPTSFSTTPLSDKVQNKKVQSPKQTPEKVGTTPNEVKQGDKFKGETTPTRMSLLERFLGQTETTPIKQGDKFKGETTPTEATQGDKFKGETTPTEATQGDKFKGETTPTEATQGDKFKGETTPTEATQGDKFKGETTPNDATQGDKFKGETTPNNFKFVQQFLGETTPNLSDRSSKFLGETTPVESDRSSKFLGETDRKNITQGDRFKGETTPNDFTFSGNLESQGFEVGKKVDFFTNDKAVGFSPFMSTVDDTKFVGIDPTRTNFDGSTSLIGNVDDTKYQIRLDNDTGLGAFYSNSVLKDTYNKFSLKNDSFNRSPIKQPFIIRGIQTKKGEPQVSGIGSTSFIRGGALTSTERAALDVLRISEFLLTPRGLTWAAKQVGLQKSQKFDTKWKPDNLLATIGGQHTGLRPDRGGVSLAKEAALKYFKIGNPLEEVINNTEDLKSLYGDGSLEPKKLNISNDSTPTGFTWQSYQGGFGSVYGLGTTNITRKYNSIDNSSIDFGNENGGNSEVNFKIRFNPFDLAMKTYEETITDGESYKTELDTEVERFTKINVGKESSTDKNERTVKTYHKQKIEKGGSKFNPFEETDTSKEVEKLYEKSVPLTDEDELSKFGVASQITEESSSRIDNTTRLKSEGFTDSQPDIADYSAISYGIISKISKDRHKNPSSLTDFRQEKDVKPEKSWSDNNDDKIEKRFGFPDSGQMRQKDNKTRSQINQYGENISDFQSADEIQSLGIGETGDDLVNMIFQQGTEGSRIQFRGTIAGLAENFSPSYTEIKYSGRAEPVYVYDTFKRDISFNFKVYPTSRAEMKPIWKKLERLSTYTMPDYLSNGYTAPGEDGNRELLLTIGHLYEETPMILTSLSYTYSDETAWDIEYGLPMGIEIAVGCTILGNDLHQYDSEKVFSFNTDIRS